MARLLLCARPGCAGTVAAWLTYDYAGQRVWLDDSAGSDDGHRWALCGGHAGRLRAPRGWEAIDRRVVHRPRPDPRAGLGSPDSPVHDSPVHDSPVHDSPVHDSLVS